jgi:hypothetical protein
VIPVFITTNGRWEMLATCIASLRARGLEDITVIDNTGTGDRGIPTGVNYIAADNTYRHLAPWGMGLLPVDRPYIITDDDCAITDDCPDDFVEKMLAVLKAWPEVPKVGLGINTANFPDPPPARYSHSFKMEKLVATYPMLAPGVRDAPIDTTFAMYRAGGEWPGVCGVRLEAPYLIEHLPWLNAEYTEEEHAYYNRPDMVTWARTHSASSEVAAKVLVPFTALRAETIVALGNSNIAYELVARPITDDAGYFHALDEAWTPTPEHEVEPFIVVEHDIVVRPDTLHELLDCPEDWCAMPYPYLDKPEAWGMGCVKFTDRLICRNPWLFREIETQGDRDHPPGHWCRMDSRIWTYLTNRGEQRHDHPGPALGHVGHPGKGSSAHGCVSI